MPITSALEFTFRVVVRSAGVAAVALAVAACDLGGRDKPPPDTGFDAGPDAGEDAGPVEPDAGADASFRYQDAGAWEGDPDGSVEVTEPCGNDCTYAYNMTPREDDDPYSDTQYGHAMFEISLAGDDLVVARELHGFLFFLYPGVSPGYRQRALSRLVLDADTHDLVSGEALVYNAYCKSLYSGNNGIEMTKEYEFSYDAVAGELTYSVESNGRRWERLLESPEPPIVMLNHREYPIDTFGSHSPLTALLLAERYDWSAGGAQRVPIFSPELERIDAVELEADGPDTLVVRYPIDSAKAPWHSTSTDAVYDINEIPIRFEYDVPVHMGSRNNFEWTAVYAPPLELNLLSPAGDPVEVALPAVPTGSAAISAVSGAATLHGLVDVPPGAGPHAAVVMIPGWERMTARGEVGAVDLYAQLAARLVAAGAVAARFGARGIEDGGDDFAEATVEGLVADAQAAVAAVAARGDVDPDRVFLLTTGAGVHVAAGAAAGGEIAGIVLVAPIGGAYLDAVPLVTARYLESANMRGEYIDEFQDLNDALFARLANGTYDGDAYLGHTTAAWQSLFAEDLVANPIALPPTLVLYGAEDHLVPQALVEELAAALSGALLADGGVDADAGPGLTDVTTAILPGLTHALTPGTADGLWPEHGGAEAVDDGAATAMTDWLAAIAGGL